MIAGPRRRTAGGDRRRSPRNRVDVLVKGVAVALWPVVALVMATAGCRAATPPPAAAGRMVVSHPGVYRITARDLSRNLGWTGIDPATLTLRLRGRAQPLRVTTSGDGFTLAFYGTRNPGQDSAEHVYWIAPGTDAARAPSPVGPAVTPDRFAEAYRPAAADGSIVLTTVHAEVNAVYEPERGDGDPWLWRALPAHRTEVFTATVGALAAGPSRLRVALWGATEAPATPDHRVRITVNGRPAADDTWDGRTGHVVDAVLPDGVLRPGANAIAVDTPGVAGVAVDIPILDWIALDHPRPARADDGRLAFTAPLGPSVTLVGFSGVPAVWDVTDPAQPVAVDVEPGDGPAETEHTDRTPPHQLRTVPGHRYAAAVAGSARTPDRIEPATLAPDLRAPARGADWLAIGPADLLPALEPLAAHRRAQGLEATAVPLAAVFDQFGHGQAEPDGIRAFLRHAHAAWRPAPRYVVLVGDATFDPRGFTVPAAANRLPTFLIRTVFGGQTGSDVGFARLDGDLVPDLAIGRIPARSSSQVDVLVAKILAYESAGDADWRTRVLAVADGEEVSFEDDAERFLAAMARPYAGTVLTAPPDGGGMTDTVRDRLHEGVGVLAYFGHGSVNQWGKDRIFTVDDVPSLANAPRLPIVLNLTCLTGLFTHPTLDALAEAMLWDEDGGAVAALAPTSLTLAGDQRALAHALAQGLTDGRHARLGDAVLDAWRAVPTDAPGGRDVMQTFLLLGDPALQLP